MLIIFSPWLCGVSEAMVDIVEDGYRKNQIHDKRKHGQIFICLFYQGKRKEQFLTRNTGELLFIAVMLLKIVS